MDIDRDETLKTLNEIVELELAGVVRFTQYSLMVFGHARIPITSWMRDQAQQALAHAIQAGEEVTALGGNVSLSIGELVGTHHPSVDDILAEMLIQERRGNRVVPPPALANRGAQRVARGAGPPDDPQ